MWLCCRRQILHLEKMCSKALTTAIERLEIQQKLLLLGLNVLDGKQRTGGQYYLVIDGQY